MEILPLASKSGAGAALLGLLCGVLYAGLGLVVDLAGVGVNVGTVLAFGAILGMPLLFGVAGFAGGALAALLVNAVRAMRGH